jgi:hypothetical protein
MNLQKNKILILEKITGTSEQKKILYNLLKMRKHNISNRLTPSVKDHNLFVNNHPYRAWYLIKLNTIYIGSVYVMKSNCIGISLIKYLSSFPHVLSLILEKHQPLREIKSIRPPHFYINIAPNNKFIESQLINLKAKKIQLTYSLVTIGSK